MERALKRAALDRIDLDIDLFAHVQFLELALLEIRHDPNLIAHDSHQRLARLQTLADEMMQWMEEADVDGFNLLYSVTPADFTDFVDLVVPELQRRGIYKTAYQPGTLREKLYGQGCAHLPDTHPGAAYRVASSLS